MKIVTAQDAQTLLDNAYVCLERGAERGHKEAAARAKVMQDMAGTVALVATAAALETIAAHLAGIHDVLRSIDGNSIVTERRS